MGYKNERNIVPLSAKCVFLGFIITESAVIGLSDTSTPFLKSNILRLDLPDVLFSLTQTNCSEHIVTVVKPILFASTPISAS